MAEPLLAETDWTLAEGLYKQGDLSLEEICRQCNIRKVDTLKKRAQRHQWTPIRAAMRVHSSTITVTPKHDPDDRARPKIKGLIDKYLDHPLLNSTAKTMNQLKDQTGVLQCVATTAKHAYGWSDSSESRIIRVDLLNQAIVEPVSQRSIAPPPAIDVAPQPVD